MLMQPCWGSVEECGGGPEGEELDFTCIAIPRLHRENTRPLPGQVSMIMVNFGEEESINGSLLVTMKTEASRPTSSFRSLSSQHEDLLDPCWPCHTVNMFRCAVLKASDLA